MLLIAAASARKLGFLVPPSDATKGQIPLSLRGEFLLPPLGDGKIFRPPNSSTLICGGNDVRSPEQLLLGDQLGVHFRCALGRQILTPRNHIHAKCLADLRDGAADIPETENAQRSPGHVVLPGPLGSFPVDPRTSGIIFLVGGNGI